MSSRIVLAEGNDLLRQGLRTMIEQRSAFRIVAEARDCAGAVAAVAPQRADVVLMDPAQPGPSGLDATRRIKERWPSVGVIAFSEHRNIDYVRSALRAGVDAYLLKNASLDELLLAIGHVLAGKKFLSAELSSELVDGFLKGGVPGEPASPLAALTARERRILMLVAEGNTSRQVADLLEISRRTVEKHRAQLMQKLHLKNVAELVLWALDHGLVERARIGRAPGAGAARKGGAGSAERAVECAKADAAQ